MQESYDKRLNLLIHGLEQGFLNYGLRPQMGSPKIILGIAKQIGILCFVPQNFENPSSAAELLEKIMVIAHVIGKSENLGTKIGKLELDSECEPFF